MMGVFDILGTTASGWLTDRFNSRHLLFTYYALRGISLLFLPYTLATNETGSLTWFAVFYGLGSVVDHEVDAVFGKWRSERIYRLVEA